MKLKSFWKSFNKNGSVIICVKYEEPIKAMREAIFLQLRHSMKTVLANLDSLQGAVFLMHVWHGFTKRAPRSRSHAKETLNNAMYA